MGPGEGPRSSATAPRGGPVDIPTLRALLATRAAERTRGVDEAHLTPLPEPEVRPFGSGEIDFEVDRFVTSLDKTANEVTQVDVAEIARATKRLQDKKGGTTVSEEEVYEFVQAFVDKRAGLVWDIFRKDPAIIDAPARLAKLATALQQAQDQPGPGARAEYEGMWTKIKDTVREYDDAKRRANETEVIISRLETLEIEKMVSDTDA